MKMIASRHRGQHHNFKNMAGQSRRAFDSLRTELTARVDEAFRQAMDSMNAMEWMTLDHMREEVIPRYQEPWISSMLGEKRVRFADDVTQLPRTSTSPPTVGLGVGPSTAPPESPSSC